MAAFATAEDLATFVQRDLDAADTATAELLLDLASDAIRKYTRQQISLVEDDEVTLRGTWEQELWLPQRPVTEVTEVSVTDSLGVVTPVTVFSWTRAGLLLNRGFLTATYGWAGPHSVVNVIYSHGYSVVPDVVRYRCLVVAGRAMENPEGIQSDQVGDKAVSFFPNQSLKLIEEDRLALADFRRRVASVRT